MDFLSLNHDVLALVVSYLSQSDALSLCRTCRTLHLLALSHALSVVILERPHQVISFCTYMLADTRNRPACLRSLRIDIWAFMVRRNMGGDGDGTILEPDFSSSQLLTDLLTETRNLKHLSLAHVCGLLSAEPTLGNALIALPNLVEIDLQEVSVSVAAVVQHLCSKPRRLVLSHFVEERLHHRTFFTFLAPLQSLHTLEVSDLSVRGRMLLDDAQQITRPQFPNLRHLTITESAATMSAFVHAFPGLRSLKVRYVSFGPRPQDDPDDPACWEHLDAVHMWARDFMYWRVVCPVRWLDLDADYASAADEVSFAVEAVRCMAPVVLSLHARTNTSDAFWTALMEVMQNVHYFDLELCGGSRLDAWLETVPAMMQSLKLVCVRLRIRDFMLPGDASQHNSIMRQLPSLFATSIPSVCIVAFEVFDGKPLNLTKSSTEGCSWWRVRRAGEECSLEPLAPHVGQRVHEYLHSVVSVTEADIEEQLLSLIY